MKDPKFAATVEILLNTRRPLKTMKDCILERSHTSANFVFLLLHKEVDCPAIRKVEVAVSLSDIYIFFFLRNLDHAHFFGDGSGKNADPFYSL